MRNKTGDIFAAEISKEDKELFLIALENTSLLNREQRRRVINILLKYYQYFLPSMGSIKSLDVIFEILS